MIDHDGDRIYFSPYIHALRDTNMSSTTYVEAAMEYARMVRGHFGGALTELEALKGVPGEFNSVNLNTSMGAPYYGPKHFHINQDRTEISPELAADIDELESILANKRIPRIVAECTLKDEVLKRGKPARVFCMMPAAFNIVCKRRFAPLKRALSHSFGTSQCAVGIDMGSLACEDLVQFLLGYGYLYDMDCSRMDKNWTPQCWDAVALAIKEITLFSAGEQLAWEAWALVMSMKEAIIYLKGDMFTLYWNISGNDITVQLNSILMSILLIHVARERGVQVAPITYGDDVVMGTQEPLPEDFFHHFTSITGFPVTDGQKNASPTAVAIGDLVFLKRRFRYDFEVRRWTAPLEEASIVKMLLYRGKSSLTWTDHERALVEAASRYALLHGRRVYESWEPFLRTLDPQAKILNYDEAMQAYAIGKYSDWCDRTTLVHDGCAASKIVHQGKDSHSFYSMTTTVTDATTNESIETVVPTDHQDRKSVV